MRNLTAKLAAAVGPANVLDDPDVVAGYATDWTGRYRGPATCVVRPGSTQEVAAVLRACAANGVAVVPQGGNTGLVGGSVPWPARAGAGEAGSPGEPSRAAVILSAARLTSLEPVDRHAGQVTAGAGVTIGRLSAHAAAAGLRYGVDLASRDSATVGGTIATNAGGIHTIRYGPTRSQLAGLTAVLADGTVVGDLSGLTAGRAGYDLAHLLVGSEGTLGVITAARLRLWPAERAGAVLLCGVAGLGQAAELTGRLRSAADDLLAAEYIDARGIDLVRVAADLPPPLPEAYPGYFLAELGASGGKNEDHFLQRIGVAGLPSDTAVAFDGRGQAALWAYRELVTEAIAASGIPHKIDVAVPGGSLAGFRAELDDVVAAAVAPGEPGGPPRVIVFGHVGVDNLHVNVLGPDPSGTSVEEAVARLALAWGGSAVAEHGVGRAKASWLEWARSPADVGALRAIKAALDPDGLLNPGVLLPRG